MEYPDNSMVRLDNATISGTNLLVYGNGNTISGNYCTIHGDGNWVMGRNATICGNRNNVSAWTSTVYGNQNQVSGMYAHVHGSHNSLTGIYSQAHGLNNQVSNFASSGVSDYTTGMQSAVGTPTTMSVYRFTVGATTPMRHNPASFQAPRVPPRRVRPCLTAQVKPAPTMIKLHLRGSDEETNVEEQACLICAEHQRVVMSTCCAALSSCVACAKKMYTNKPVGDVKCMLCQAPVTDVYRVS